MNIFSLSANAGHISSGDKKNTKQRARVSCGTKDKKKKKPLAHQRGAQPGAGSMCVWEAVERK